MISAFNSSAVVRRIAYRATGFFLAAFLIAIALSNAWAQSKENSDQSSLGGKVCTADGKPIGGALVLLSGAGSELPTVKTDDRGRYSFEVRPGLYSLHLEKKGYNATSIGAISIQPGQKKAIDVTLNARSSSPEVPQFYDQPQFTVSGVTDTTNLGGHGSDTIVRTRDSLAKETAALGKDSSPQPSSAAEHEQASIHHRAADSDEKSGDSLAAVREYQRAAELDPSEPYLFDWGTELLLHHAPEPAVEVFGKGVRSFPGSIRMKVALGASLFAQGSAEQAIKTICEASDLQPDNPVPYLFLGKIDRAESSSSPELLDHLRRFATLHPESPEANYYYAASLWKAQKTNPDPANAQQVEKLLNRAIQLDPKFGVAYLQLGIVHFEQGYFAKAIPDLQRAAQFSPENEEAHYRLGQAYRRTGEAEKSRAELQTYERMSKESAESRERERHEIRQFVYTLRDQSPRQP